MAEHDIDSVCNPSGNEHFADVVEVDEQRRTILKGGSALAVASFFGMPALSWTSRSEAFSSPVLGFQPVPVSSEDLVRVPANYVVQVLYAWGDPVSNGPEFKPDASNSAADQELQAGMHHDGMHLFPLPFPMPGRKANSNRGILVMNHEYTDDGLLHVGGMEPWTAEKVRKSQAAHGVSMVEVKFNGSSWEVVRPSRYGRRLTGYSPMRVTGPAAGHPLMQTQADPSGRAVLGTLNNCAHGYTPWGTYLTCEENWNGYFSNETGDVTGVPGQDQKLEILTGQSRYGITKGGFGYRWHEHDERFRADLHPNEPNRFGWVVEVDPYNNRSVPAKRTALGRFKHEGAAVTIAKDGRAVVYMGDDERNEYVYKFVSARKFNNNRRVNANLLDEGTLYVAKFKAGHTSGDLAGIGEWIPLVHGQNGLTAENGFADQAEVLIKTRQAADRVGATMMDRPEWIAVDESTKDVYVTCTNNNRRGSTPESSNKADGTTSAGSARPAVDESNPRKDNRFGHIIRWRERNSDPASRTFTWDVFVLCGDPTQTKPEYQGNINGDAFGSPDGLWIDHDGRMWIQTDISTSVVGQNEYANIGNNQMLCADLETREIRRFLTGVKGCEVTGVITTPDGTSMFVNIQHPGEPASEKNDPADPEKISSWPFSQGYGPKGRPRAATIVIRKNDGGVVGS